MTQEEKAKTYDEVREKIALRFGSNVAEEIFSEFEMSEDERIRKMIINHLTQERGSLSNEEAAEALAWLEKQKEYESTDFEYVWDRTDCGDLTSALDKYSKEAIINMCHAWYDKGIELERKSWLEKQGYTKKDVDDAYLKGICDTKHELEKQGEQPRYSIGDVLCDKSCTTLNKDTQPHFEIIDIRDGMYICDKGSFPISQQDEYELVAKKIDQKPVKVPKFKVGDFIQFNGMGHYRYTIKDVCGLSHYINSFDRRMDMAYTDNNFELVEQKTTNKHKPKFQNGQWIVWQNKYYKINYNGCGYELIDQNGLSTSLEYGTVDKSAHLWTIQNDAKDGDVLVFKNNIGGIIICKSPSDYDTRSYCRLIRDNLINKEESGWDSTLLVPATKEQRDLLFQKMKEAGYEWDFEKKELKKISQRMVSAEAKEALYDKPTDEEMKELLRTEYEKGRADTIAEMEKDWSEEDEVKINRIVACLENLNVADNDILLKDVDWLKSLKDRVIPKPKHEWSIEDERVIAIINNALTESNTPPDDYDKVYDWLESIKQRIGG